MVGLLSGMNLKEYTIESNCEAGKGRGDIIVRHINQNGKAIIFELKYTVQANAMESLANQAIRQIEEQQYDRALLQAGFGKDNIIKYGVCFHKKSCLVKVKI